MNILYLVIPCYNEEEVLKTTAAKVKAQMQALMDKGKIDKNSRVMFVNDGSMDLTWKLIKDLYNEDKLFGGINLTRNRGHQNALLAGLLTVKEKADMVISMDADLQDDVTVIEPMVDEYIKGYDVVYGVRSNRKKDSFFKRFSAQAFYKLTKEMGGDIVYNHADCRLMSKRAIEGLEQFSEVNLFLRGIVPMIGYPSTSVMYERQERVAGKSKYPLGKMLGFALEGITSLSVRPIRMVTGLGFLVFGGSLIMLIYVFASYFMGRTVPGWSSVAVSVWVIGGALLLSMGIVGEYIGKIYMETKKRPRYIVEEILDGDEENKDE